MQQLDIVDKNLSVLDIDINIGRHTTDNLGTKTTAFAALVGTGEIATIDALEMSGLTTRTAEVVERGKKAKEEKREEALEYMKKQAEVNPNGQNYDTDDNNVRVSSYNYNYSNDNNGNYTGRRRYRRRNYNNSNNGSSLTGSTIL